ncbi:MAG: RagB/SusD family nutrient uptake outer membrane protein, partial [Bacteroidales bacterium]|nr:RagB/SusD family nutrient uptake outer membrane protein [Bacteroidales bacterium]
MKKLNYIKMKGMKYISLPVMVLAVLLASCQDLIDLKPYSSIDENAAFSTPSLIELSVVGMYQAAQRGDYA